MDFYYGENDYGMYNDEYGGRMDRFGNIRYTRPQIIQVLRDYCTNSTGVYISKEEKIDEAPQLLRHACAEAGISQLSMYEFPVQAMGISVPFYFCKACGKLFYMKDFM